MAKRARALHSPLRRLKSKLKSRWAKGTPGRTGKGGE